MQFQNLFELISYTEITRVLTLMSLYVTVQPYLTHNWVIPRNGWHIHFEKVIFKANYHNDNKHSIR